MGTGRSHSSGRLNGRMDADLKIDEEGWDQISEDGLPNDWTEVRVLANGDLGSLYSQLHSIAGNAEIVDGAVVVRRPSEKKPLKAIVNAVMRGEGLSLPRGSRWEVKSGGAQTELAEKEESPETEMVGAVRIQTRLAVADGGIAATVPDKNPVPPIAAAPPSSARGMTKPTPSKAGDRADLEKITSVDFLGERLFASEEDNKFWVQRGGEFVETHNHLDGMRMVWGFGAENAVRANVLLAKNSQAREALGEWIEGFDIKKIQLMGGVERNSYHVTFLNTIREGGQRNLTLVFDADGNFVKQDLWS